MGMNIIELLCPPPPPSFCNQSPCCIPLILVSALETGSLWVFPLRFWLEKVMHILLNLCFKKHMYVYNCLCQVLFVAGWIFAWTHGILLHVRSSFLIRVKSCPSALGEWSLTHRITTKVLNYLFFFFPCVLWLWLAECGILVPWQQISPMSPAEVP